MPLGLGNGWTGGQYSIFRALFGSYLLLHFTALLPWGAELFSDRGALNPASASPILHLFPNALALLDAPWFVALLLGGASLASACFAIGMRDRGAALVCWYVLACLLGRNPLISNPSLPFVGWMLLAHACLPSAPYGSWAARAKADPGRWRMPREIHAAVWIVMALGYSYSGLTKLLSPSWLDGSALSLILQNPLARPRGLGPALATLPPVLLQLGTWSALGLELLFAPLALSRRARPWLWLAMLGMHAGLLATLDFADLSFGMILLHGFSFDPAWVKSRVRAHGSTVFYDGDCGLCHSFVRFVLSEDAEARFRFAPLQSSAFEKLPAAQRAGLPDSVVVQLPSGELQLRSAAVLEVLAGLGGIWRVAGSALRRVPVSLRDAAYDGIARIRKRLFAAPAAACPVLPAELQKRFLA